MTEIQNQKRAQRAEFVAHVYAAAFVRAIIQLESTLPGDLALQRRRLLEAAWRHGCRKLVSLEEINSYVRV